MGADLTVAVNVVPRMKRGVDDITPKKVVIFLACCVILMFAMILIPVALETWKI